MPYSLSLIALLLSVACGAKPAHTHRTSKLTGPVSIRVDLVGPPPAQTGDTFEVVGIVSSAKSITGVSLEWSIGESIELVSGLKTQNVDLEAGQPIQVRLTLKALRPGAQLVRLTASSGPSEGRVSSSGRLNMNPASEAASPAVNTIQTVGQPEVKDDTKKKKLPKKFH